MSGGDTERESSSKSEEVFLDELMSGVFPNGNSQSTGSVNVNNDRVNSVDEYGIDWSKTSPVETLSKVQLQKCNDFPEVTESGIDLSVVQGLILERSPDVIDRSDKVQRIPEISLEDDDRAKNGLVKSSLGLIKKIFRVREESDSISVEGDPISQSVPVIEKIDSVSGLSGSVGNSRKETSGDSEEVHLSTAETIYLRPQPLFEIESNSDKEVVFEEYVLSRESPVECDIFEVDINKTYSDNAETVWSEKEVYFGIEAQCDECDNVLQQNNGNEDNCSVFVLFGNTVSLRSRNSIQQKRLLMTKETGIMNNPSGDNYNQDLNNSAEVSPRNNNHISESAYRQGQKGSVMSEPVPVRHSQLSSGNETILLCSVAGKSEKKMNDNVKAFESDIDSATLFNRWRMRRKRFDWVVAQVVRENLLLSEDELLVAIQESAYQLDCKVSKGKLNRSLTRLKLNSGYERFRHYVKG